MDNAYNQTRKLSSGTIATLLSDNGHKEDITYVDCENLRLALTDHAKTGNFETWRDVVKSYYRK